MNANAKSETPASLQLLEAAQAIAGPDPDQQLALLAVVTGIVSTATNIPASIILDQINLSARRWRNEVALAAGSK